MFKSKYILLFLLLAFCFTDCKKYPEGPWISLRSKEKRLLGNWKVQKYLIDGVDSTSTKFPNLSSSVCVYSFAHYGQYVDDGCYSTGGKWGWGNKKESLIVGLEFGSILTPFFLSTSTEWTILRLSNKDMHLKTTFSSMQYEIFLKKNPK